MTSYRLEDPPSNVVDEGSGPLPSHYVAEFISSEGQRLQRFLTEAVLRRMDEGQLEFSPDEVQDFTVEPDIEALVAQMERESGEGA